MSSWKAPTKKDKEGLARNETVRAPCCGRKTSVDMLVDVTGHPAKARPRGANYICDGCRERLFATGVMTRNEFFDAFNPPASYKARLKEFEDRRNNK